MQRQSLDHTGPQAEPGPSMTCSIAKWLSIGRSSPTPREGSGEPGASLDNHGMNLQQALDTAVALRQGTPRRT